MKAKQMAGGATTTYALVLDQGEEAVSALSDWAASRQVSAPGQPQPHLHAVLGLHDGTTRGGHLLEGVVWPTLEVIVREAPAELRKIYRPDIGLALIDLDLIDLDREGR